MQETYGLLKESCFFLKVQPYQAVSFKGKTFRAEDIFSHGMIPIVHKFTIAAFANRTLNIIASVNKLGDPSKKITSTNQILPGNGIKNKSY